MEINLRKHTSSLALKIERIATSTTVRKATTIGLAATATFLLSDSAAMAQQVSNGFASIMTSAADQSKSIIGSLQVISTLVGVCTIIAGIAKLRQKSREGDHSQVKTSHVAILFVTGALFCSPIFLLDTTSDSLNIKETDRVAIDQLDSL